MGTWLHPMEADPNQPVAAFAEYAANHMWVASHLTQLFGIALLVSALMFLSQQLRRGRAVAWAEVAAGGATVSLAVAAALQAVDGIALKRMVDAWAAAPVSQKDVVFQAAFAVRQIEIGLASILGLSMGLTMTVFGAALLLDQTYPKWFSALAVIGGVATTAGGVALAYTGFSELAMEINMPANYLLLLWMLVLGGFMWRDSRVRQKETAD